jgi:hypothetical protein
MGFFAIFIPTLPPTSIAVTMAAMRTSTANAIQLAFLLTKGCFVGCASESLGK